MTMKTREAKLVVLLLGFLSGNLFGSILTFLRQFFVWDGLIITMLLLTGEIISYMSYNKKIYKHFLSSRRSKFCVAKPHSYRVRVATQNLDFLLPSKGKKGSLSVNTQINLALQSYLNFFKIGVMIGFFVDAFKVGS